MQRDLTAVRHWPNVENWERITLKSLHTERLSLFGEKSLRTQGVEGESSVRVSKVDRVVRRGVRGRERLAWREGIVLMALRHVSAVSSRVPLDLDLPWSTHHLAFKML
jgi:hypothetical protein